MTLSFRILILLSLTSFGYKDLDMRQFNPLHLHAVLEDKRFLKSQIVFLHGSYSFSREASYLAFVYSQENLLQLNGSVLVYLNYWLIGM